MGNTMNLQKNTKTFDKHSMIFLKKFSYIKSSRPMSILTLIGGVDLAVVGMLIYTIASIKLPTFDEDKYNNKGYPCRYFP